MGFTTGRVDADVLRSAARWAALLALAPWLAHAVAEDVRLDTPHGPLAGTLESPDGTRPRAAALIIAGSGPTDRDGNNPGLPGPNNSYKYLAAALRAAGIASLRFDKRLIGASARQSLTEQDLRFDTYVDDAKLWFEELHRRVGVPVYIVGHSEGSLIGILLAERVPAAALISLAGPGRRATALLLDQLRAQLPPPLFAEAEKAVAELAAGRTVASPPPELAALFRPSVQPYLISWFRYDPAAEIARVRVPVLLVYGSTDLQVPASEGRLLAAALPSARTVVIDGMNHVLKLASGDARQQLSSYGDPALPIAPELVRQIVGFIGG